MRVVIFSQVPWLKADWKPPFPVEVVVVNEPFPLLRTWEALRLGACRTEEPEKFINCIQRLTYCYGYIHKSIEQLRKSGVLKDDDCIVILTVDIPGWNPDSEEQVIRPVYGYTLPKSKIALVWIYSLDTVWHEVGHMIGLKHCQNPECLMSKTGGRLLCAECRKRAEELLGVSR